MFKLVAPSNSLLMMPVFAEGIVAWMDSEKGVEEALKASMTEAIPVGDNVNRPAAWLPFLFLTVDISAHLPPNPRTLD